MQETKTIQTIRLLTRGELQGLKHFLNNPYFNKNEEIKILFEFIYSFLPGFKGSDFTKVEAFKKISPAKEFDQKLINHLLNKLNIKIDRFLAFLELSQETTEVEMQVLKYHQRNATKFFENQFNKVDKLLHAKKTKGLDFYSVKQKTAYILAEHYSMTQPMKERNLEALLNALDAHTQYMKLTVFCDMLNHSLITNYSYDLAIVNKFIDKITLIDKDPQISIWGRAAKTLLLVRNQSPICIEDYMIFKNQLFEEKENLVYSELRNLVTYLRTILKRTDFDEEQYYQEQFSLYQFGLERSIYFIDGSLSAASVKNIITFSVRAGQSSWLDYFLANYKKYFPKNQSKELEAYCQGNIQFERKEYAKVIESLTGWEFNDIFLNLGKRILTIKAYYELEDVDLFEAQINNFRRIVTYYKNKSKITDNHSKAYLDFCSVILSIYKVIKKETSKIDKLEQEIQITHPNQLPEKKWLMLKLAEKR